MYNSYNYESSYSNSNYKKDTNPTNTYKYERKLYSNNRMTTPKTKESLNEFSNYKEQTNEIYTSPEKIKKKVKNFGYILKSNLSNYNI